MQNQVIVALREDVARLHEHVAKADDKLDTQSVQMAVLDSHVTRMTKEQADTAAQVKEVDGKVDEITRKVEKLTNKVLGGMAVISAFAFVAAELLRIWFH